MFTIDQKKDYLISKGNICPKCGSKDICSIGHEFDETIEVYMQCDNCFIEWTEYYTLTDIEEEE